MNEIVNKFLVVGDIFIPEMHLKQPEFACSVNHLLKTKKRTGDSRYIHLSQLNKACIQHDMAYGDFLLVLLFTQGQKLILKTNN